MATGTESDNSQCELNREKIMAELDEKGYCVVPNVLTTEECDKHIASYKQWHDQFKGDWPFQRHSIIQSYRIGHFAATWETRLSAKKVFETLWQTKKLLCSFDAVAISPPPEKDADDKGFTTPGAHWLHLDQSAKRQGLHCYQGAVYLEETSDTDFCFRVLEGSHKHTDDFYTENPECGSSSRKMDFFKLREPHAKWYEGRGCRWTKVPVPKGGIVLWDSRTVHDNCRPEPGRPNADRWRYVVFACMGPARWASLADLSKKRQAYKRLLMTAHWPCQDVSFFDERDSDSFSGVPLLSKLPQIARSKEAQQLAGVVEYDFEDGEPNGPAWDPQWEE
ncbi:hypothetical protein ACOMHN_042959 [Nucella lapillus]